MTLSSEFQKNLDSSYLDGAARSHQPDVWKPNPFVRNSLSPDIDQSFIDKETKTFTDSIALRKRRSMSMDTAWKIHINRAWRMRPRDELELMLRSIKNPDQVARIATKVWGIRTLGLSLEEIIQGVLVRNAKQKTEGVKVVGGAG